MGASVLDQLATYGPDRCDKLSYDEAIAYARRLAKTHYENFTVVSNLTPARFRDDFRAIYSFCRWADDLGDETGSREKSLELLAWWRRELDACYAGEPRHPVFVALHPTIEKHDIPRKPFDDLIDAFVQDQSVVRYKTWDQVVDYCTRSADPVGRLVLYVSGYRDEERQRLSDSTCTALQLANFWQDVRRDILERDRVYIPDEVASKHGLDIELMVKAVKIEAATCDASGAESRCSSCEGIPSAGVNAQREAFRETMRELVSRTWPLFERGRELWPMLEPDVRSCVKLFSYGGEAIQRMIERQNFDTLTKRPSLSKGAKLMLMGRAIVGRLTSGRSSSRGSASAGAARVDSGYAKEARRA